MDEVRTIYKELFNVKLVHEGYNTSTGSTIFNVITVNPDTATQRLFAQHQLGYRCINDTIICFIRADLKSAPAREPKVPYVLLDANTRIRFVLNVKSNFLYNTYVTATGSKAVYHFTNKINNVQSGSVYVTKAIQVYDGAKDFDAGTIVSSAGEPYVSLQPTFAANGISINNTAYWKKVLPLSQVVNNADVENVSTVKTEEPCFGVIDIFNSGTSNNAYNLLGSGQQLLSPVYTIPFKSKI